MSRIIAGHFQLQDEVAAARVALQQAGFPDSRISVFFVNQPGQHDLHALADGFTQMTGVGEAAKTAENQPLPRHPGMLIAVALSGLYERERALEALHRLGAQHIEEAEGTIANGDWHDFDPLSIPVLVA